MEAGLDRLWSRSYPETVLIMHIVQNEGKAMQIVSLPSTGVEATGRSVSFLAAGRSKGFGKGDDDT
jgi:hypothetical protein